MFNIPPGLKSLDILSTNNKENHCFHVQYSDFTLFNCLLILYLFLSYYISLHVQKINHLFIHQNIYSGGEIEQGPHHYI